MRGFRKEVARNGLSSYPHPWLMPDFWQFPTVSMGLGPIMAIYQARFMKYLQGRGLAETAGRKVWAFLGDGEMRRAGVAGRDLDGRPRAPRQPDLRRQLQPAAARRAGARQRQDHPGARDDFRGAGWNVIKVIWGSRWDPLLAADHEGLLLAAHGGGASTATTRRTSRATAPTCASTSSAPRRSCARWSRTCPTTRSGRSTAAAWTQRKVYAAYKAAVENTGPPTVILAKTIKGYGMGEAGEGQNITHQQKKMAEDALLAFRDRFELPLTDEQAELRAVLQAAGATRAEMEFLRERRAALGGSLPARRRKRRGGAAGAAALELFESQLEGTGEREISTTMAFVRVLSALVRDKQLGRHVVPIVPDESRTFGMEGMFRQLGIFSQVGQLYTPEDAEQLMFYREDKKGQILQEGINEAGRVLVLDRGGHVVLQPRRPDDPVLHLLLDVRLPAGRRPRLGRRRQPRARVPARRHRGAHDAQRRGPAARGRPLARAVARRSRTASPTTRPTATRSR